jgi:hypothetical protein
MKRKLLDRIGVKTPCNESWEEMTGNNDVRFCSHCSKNVYDLSSMTRIRAEKLVRDSNGHLCVRYVKDPRDKIVTAPPKLTLITRRATIAASALATSLALATLAYSQSDPAPIPVNGKAVINVASQKSPDTSGSFSISGVVQDINGAIVPGARIVLTLANTDTIRYTNTNDEGHFGFKNIESGNYDLEITSPGFKKFVLQNLRVSESINLESELILDSSSEIVGELTIVEGPPVETSEPQISTEIQPRSLLPLPRVKIFPTMGLIASPPIDSKKPGKPNKKAKNKLPK